ncbi:MULTISPECIES: FepA family TonB-dependent siderophore receptor [unclassified Pseudomonas]|uniref:FepA family TonB-dependent siderophore receptor n=1 Tax=unclassified Pseudomonas TaxID=196821 RepID=UPI00244B49D2|nr:MULTISPECIES: FepA family TonB-dependent siderophore receptor [unclassified Pseudomonas]MDG9924986.1 FepA family TonB-dependent siderophore receptor [Pseudomonas sp. GD04045]MDH0036267.1 FepA family TonB-dependent siderophore receptor [Pseudomonas sp. GD04019]
MQPRFRFSHLTLALMMATVPQALQAASDQVRVESTDLPVAGTEQALQLEETRVLGTAEEELKQAPGVSIITAEDIQKLPPTNDLSEVIRREPGVNLTGNSTSGNRGNNRQIDLRGMGPENTLILIDGQPTTSRNAVRYGWNGDRDTRGETNWVPAEQVERIEILRGPAAARYGSGAMGGVINIITKRPTDEVRGSVTAYTSLPEDDAEGMSKRSNFSLSGPISDAFTFRLYGGASTTDADDADINRDHQASADAMVAGREGVRNKDINGLLSWQLNPEQTLDLEAGYSRQGNIYAGDTMNNNGGGNPAFIDSLYGQETNVMQRTNYALTHKGDFDWGSSKASLGYDYTRNWRLNEGLAGGPEGAPTEGAGAFMSRLRNTRANAEVSLPLSAGFEQVLTLGSEYLYESLNDPGSLRSQASWDPAPGAIPGFSRGETKVTAHSYALFVEDNIEVGERTIVTPGLRFDDHEEYGGNWSPSLNASHELTDELTLKGGIARAYKTPNMYQSNPHYLLYSRGFGCNATEANTGNGCYLAGNPNLEPETSINKEIGLSFDKGTWRTSATYFRNDYRNKIVGSNEYVFRLANGRRVLQWENTDKAVVEGVEGNLFVELSPRLDWNTNFTYMIESEDKDTGEPLSIIPEYTLNSSLDWQATEKLSFQLNGTYYGKQESPSTNPRRQEAIPDEAQKDIDPYGLMGVSAGYEFSENYSLRVGINNLFDKRIYREGNATEAGANTYNEPGRAYFASVTASF